jgi:uncharacterized protein YukE
VTREVGFLNVDLEVGARTRSQLAPLLDAFEGKLFELFRGRIRGLYRAHYESIGCGRDASATIRDLVASIEALDRPARRAWDGAAMRDFNIGVELGRGVRSVELAIDREVIQQVAAFGGRIAFTAYNEAAMPRRRLTRGGTARPSGS